MNRSENKRFFYIFYYFTMVCYRFFSVFERLDSKKKKVNQRLVTWKFLMLNSNYRQTVLLLRWKNLLHGAVMVAGFCEILSDRAGQPALLPADT